MKIDMENRRRGQCLGRGGYATNGHFENAAASDVTTDEAKSQPKTGRQGDTVVPEVSRLEPGSILYPSLSSLLREGRRRYRDFMLTRELLPCCR